MSEHQKATIHIKLVYENNNDITEENSIIYEIKNKKLIYSSENDFDMPPPFGVNDPIPRNYKKNEKEYILAELTWTLRSQKGVKLIWGDMYPYKNERQTLKDIEQKFSFLPVLGPLHASLIRHKTEIKSPFEDTHLLYDPKYEKINSITKEIIIIGINVKFGFSYKEIPLIRINYNEETLIVECISQLTQQLKSIQKIKHHDNKHINALIVKIFQDVINEDNIPEHEKIQKMLNIQSYDCGDFFARVVEHHKAFNALKSEIEKCLSKKELKNHQTTPSKDPL